MTYHRLSIPLAILVILALLAPATPVSAAVILAGFEGKAAPPDTVYLGWRTEVEQKNVGFHVWRQTEPGNAAEIAFVPSTAPPSGLGATYAYTDTVTPGLYTYWLVSEDKAGNLTAHDAIQVAVSGPTAVTLTSLSAGLTCYVLRERSCQCYTRSGWRAYPMLFCRLTGRS